jgi:hypothetical protein
MAPMTSIGARIVSSSSSRGRVVAALAVVALLVAPSASQAGSFLDPDARMFTLQWRDGPLSVKLNDHSGRVRAMPDGSVLFTVGDSRPNLWQLGLDGALSRIGWAGTVVALATEPDGGVLIVRRGRTVVERLQLESHRRTVVADLAAAPGYSRAALRWGASMIVLDDGSIVVAIRERIWRIAPGGATVRVPLRLMVDALAPLEGGSFAVLTGSSVVRVDGDGATRPWVADAAVGTPLAATGDGGLALATTSLQSGVALTVVDALGRATRYERAGTALGSGDGVPLPGLPWSVPRSMTITTDGSLAMMTQGNKLRAVIPPDSPRPRLAISQTTYEAFSQGRVHYLAGDAGWLELELRRDGKTIARASGSTTGGHGEISLPSAPAPGTYDLRLRLVTATAITEARAHLDTRVMLPLSEARRAVGTQRTGDAGDDAGGAGTSVGNCQRLEARTVQCLIMSFEWYSNTYDGGNVTHSSEVPAGFARARLRNDGSVLTDFEPVTPTRAAPTLRLEVPRRQHVGADPRIRAQVSTPDRVSATVSARVMVSGLRRQRVVHPISHRLGGREPWNARLRLGPYAKAVRRWLRSGRHITAFVEATLTVDAGPGPASVTEIRTIALVL